MSSGLAQAQIDDPGLAPPPPPPSTPNKANPTPAVASPNATSAAPGTYNEAPVKEEVKEEVSVMPATTLTPEEWEARLVAPSISGSVGLLRVKTAEVGLPLNFRVASHLQLFQKSSFLVAGSGSIPGDENSRFLGDLTIGLTGPDVTFLRHLEIYLAILNSSNQNKRTDAGRTDPTVILALADVGAGIKGAYEFAKGLSLGLDFGLRFFNSISGVSAQFDATNINIDALATFDVRRYAPSAPLRLHLNAGYINDNSVKLLPAGQCMNSTGNDSCIRSRVVETFAYGLNNSRVRLALALDLPFHPKVSWGYFGVELFGEYHVEIGVGDGDTTMRDKLIMQANADMAGCGADAACLTRVSDFKNRVTGQAAQWLTFGIRLRPVARLVLDAGIDVAIASPGYQYGPPLAPYNVIFGAAYTYGGGENRLVTRTVSRTYEVNRRPPEGKVSGVVRDAKTKKAIAGAIVRYPQVPSLSPQATGEDGSFTSYNLPPGPIAMAVSAPDYDSENASATVTADQNTPLTVSLKPQPPKEGVVRVRVTDDRTNPLPGATARLAGPVSREAQLEGETLIARVPGGEYTVTVDANNFLSKDKQIVVQAGQEQIVEFSLNKRPKTSHVEIKANEITIKGTIHFATNEATILPDGQQIVNEVVDVLAKNPQIRKVSVEGHTDNQGDADKNMQLSKDRAAAVVEYMSKNGIHRDRLSSQGFGQTKPLVPNLSGPNRAKNRRVEFKIIEQSGAPGGMPF